MIPKEQIAHDLAMVYLNNRYGADVVGDFNVYGDRDSVTGNGEVETKRMVDVDEVKYEKYKTGNKKKFGPFKFDEKSWRENGYEVDDIFYSMIIDYKKAYEKFLKLIEE